MKGKGCKVLASQGNCSLTSRPPFWKLGEIDPSSSYWERPRTQLSHFLGACSDQFGAASTITFSCSCFVKISDSDCVLKVKYYQSGLVATCLLEQDPAEI